MFDDQKAGQVAAFFASAGRGHMDVIKLIKLIYRLGARRADGDTGQRNGE